MYFGHFDFSQPLLRVVPAVWSRARCAGVLERARGNGAGAGEWGGWLPATVNSAAGRVVDEAIRDNATLIVRDKEIENELFSSLREHVPARMSATHDGTGERVMMAVEGLFSPLRIYRYEVGQHFGLHEDQSYERADGARSLLTLIVYLNDDFEGGETDFPQQNERIRPSTGDALWFQHRLLHAGLRVTRGEKYVLRTDVLYRVVL